MNPWQIAIGLWMIYLHRIFVFQPEDKDLIPLGRVGSWIWSLIGFLLLIHGLVP